MQSGPDHGHPFHQSYELSLILYQIIIIIIIINIFWGIKKTTQIEPIWNAQAA